MSLNSITGVVGIPANATFMVSRVHHTHDCGTSHYKGDLTVICDVTEKIKVDKDVPDFGFVISCFDNGRGVQCNVYKSGTLVGHLEIKDGKQVDGPESGTGNCALCNYLIDALEGIKAQVPINEG